MAHWDSTQNKIITVDPIPDPDYSGWETVDCICCNGLEWGGEYPRECKFCRGNGYYSRHIETGTLAEYPGGPFLGKDVLITMHSNKNTDSNYRENGPKKYDILGLSVDAMQVKSKDDVTVIKDWLKKYFKDIKVRFESLDDSILVTLSPKSKQYTNYVITVGNYIVLDLDCIIVYTEHVFNAYFKELNNSKK